MTELTIKNRQIRGVFELVQNDSGTNPVSIALDRVQNDVDLSDFLFSLTFENTEHYGYTVALDKSDESTEDTLVLLWSPDSLVTQMAGRIRVQITAQNGEAQWSTIASDFAIRESITPKAINRLVYDMETNYRKEIEAIISNAKKDLESMSTVSPLSEAEILAIMNQGE